MSEAKTGSSNAVAAVIGTLAVFMLLAALGMSLWGRDQPQEPGLGTNPEDLDPNRKLVHFSVNWGHFGTDEDGIERLLPDDRDLTINYWIDGNRFAVPGGPDPYEEGAWNEYHALSPGVEVRLRVEQHGTGGFLQCWIMANGEFVRPNGYMHRNDAGDCTVDGIVP